MDFTSKELVDKNIELLNNMTTHHLLPQWVSNFKANLAVIESSKDLMEIEKKKEPSIVIGAGPSLKRFKHLNALHKSKFNGTVFAVDKILIDCLKEGVVPDFVVSMDGDDLSSFFDSPLVDKYASKIKAIFSVTSNPNTVNRFKGEKYFFIPLIDSLEPLSVTNVLKLMTGKSILRGAGNVGTSCWFISVFLLKDPIALIGMDFGWNLYKEDGSVLNLNETDYFSKYAAMHGNDVNKIASCYRRVFHPFFKTEAITDFVFQTYWDAFLSWVKAVGVKTINCSEGGVIFGEGIDCMYFKDFLSTFDVK